VARGPVGAGLDFSPDPYVDYDRSLTPEGGLAVTYKDLDLRWRYTLRRLFFWTTASGIEAWYLIHHAPVYSTWINLALWLAAALVNWLIVRKPVEVYRTVEIRPDCMILNGSDIFWKGKMECGWPAFQPDAEGNQILCGVYGTRFVEYLTVRRFEEKLDRTPEVIAAHLQDAMQQLWTPPP
jgi:hypothetical protein